MRRSNHTPDPDKQTKEDIKNFVRNWLGHSLSEDTTGRCHAWIEARQHYFLYEDVPFLPHTLVSHLNVVPMCDENAMALRQCYASVEAPIQRAEVESGKALLFDIVDFPSLIRHEYDFIPLLFIYLHGRAYFADTHSITRNHWAHPYIQKVDPALFQLEVTDAQRIQPSIAEVFQDIAVYRCDRFSITYGDHTIVNDQLAFATERQGERCCYVPEGLMPGDESLLLQINRYDDFIRFDSTKFQQHATAYEQWCHQFAQRKRVMRSVR